MPFDLGAPSDDIYVRLNRDDNVTRFPNDPSVGGIVFVDYRRGAKLGDLRRVTLGEFHQPRLILIRTPQAGDEDALDQASDVVTMMGLHTPVARLDQFAGEPFSVLLVEPNSKHQTPNRLPSETVLEVAARARAVELRAMLEWGHAIWRPAHFHYRLPSGLHCDSFVKLADAIREPHDADVIASWFSPYMTPGLGVVLDSGTLTAIVSSISRRMADVDMDLGHVALLERFQHTQMAAQEALLSANAYGSVVAILSANSSGHLRDRLWHAFETQSALLDDRGLPPIHVLVDAAPARDVSGIDTWLPIRGEPPVVNASLHAGDCKLCLEGARKQVVHLDANTFNPIVKSEFQLLVPSTKDARLNQAFWEACDKADAIGVEETPRANRPFMELLPIRIRFERLLDESMTEEGNDVRPTFVREVRREIRENWHRPAADLVLVGARELAIEATDDSLNGKRELFPEFWSQISDLLATSGTEPAAVPDEGSWRDDLVRKVKEASNILVLALGTVTGQSLQRTLAEVQRIRGEMDLPNRHKFQVNGLVLHARPVTEREWQTLRNSFGSDVRRTPRLQALWVTFLPDTSPIEVELRALDGLGATAPQGCEDFVETRRAYRQLKPERKSRALFWCTNDETTVTPNALFGQAVHSPTVYAALASALQRARVEEAEIIRPSTALFELPAIVRSYYDPLILAALFRWLQANEIWWGHEADAADRVVMEILHRAKDRGEHYPILLAELLLAGVEGKLGTPATNRVVTAAEQYLWEIRNEPEKIAAAIPIQLGIELYDQAHRAVEALAWISIEAYDDTDDDQLTHGVIVELERDVEFSLAYYEQAIASWLVNRPVPLSIKLAVEYPAEPDGRQVLRVRVASGSHDIPRNLLKAFRPRWPHALLKPVRATLRRTERDGVADEPEGYGERQRDFLRERAAFLLSSPISEVKLSGIHDEGLKVVADVEANGSKYQLEADLDHVHLDLISRSSSC